VTGTLLERPADRRAGNGGAPARRAMWRWAWRLFRREWRQQLLVLGLVVVAVAATFVGAAVASNTPLPADSGFGAAGYRATLAGADPHLGAEIAALRHRFAPVQVIENQTLTFPGSIATFDLRAQDPHGAYGKPMLALVSGHFPAGADQVAMTAGVARQLNLKVGDTWRQGGIARRVVGIVEDPQNLLDEFALVAEGQVSAPTQVSVLFDSREVPPSSLRHEVASATSVLPANVLNPETIVLALATLAMLLIGLVAVAGFTVLAQRRLRSIGMLGALGATDRNIRLVVRANGTVVGVIGALLGAALGLAAWLAYRPHLETSAHHLIGEFQLPWAVIGPAMALAIVASFLAAARPARAVTRIPVVTALAGRPATPRPSRRSAVPGAVFLVVAFALLSYSGSQAGQGSGMAELVFGFVALTAALILLAPLCLTLLGRASWHGPVAVRLALRDLARYRARSGSALAAISLSVLIAVAVCVIAAARYSNVLDYAGPNLAANQLIVYAPFGGNGPGPGSGPPGRREIQLAKPGPGSGPPGVTGSQLTKLQPVAEGIATALGSHDVVALEATSATLNHAAAGRNFSGTLYVATPQLLRAFGINPAALDPDADILTMRSGLATTSRLQLLYGNSGPGGFAFALVSGGQESFPCPAHGCLANPKVETVSALPSGTSAPNTVITEHAVQQLGLRAVTSGWLIQSGQPLSAVELNEARHTAAAAGMSIEAKSDEPSSAEVIYAATLAGILLALGILTMTVGLIRSETGADLRTLTATGASSSTRRGLTAATAGTLALIGTLLGTVAAYIAAIAWFRGNTLNGGVSALASVPVTNLLLIVVGLPLTAALGGWILAGREPPGIGRQPIG
jgi:putative ABC transport system permease protein